jgi:thiol:disulfide interchange protein DsbD
MKKAFFFLSTLVISALASAQIANPVTWTFTSKKISDNVYEVQMVAAIQNGWHLYSQSQPKDAIAQPTSISFNKNPLVELNGGIKEVGKLEKFKDDELGISANQYSKLVVFTQKIKLKGKAKTALTGKVSFQTCDDKKCLPPKTVNFTVSI